MHLHAIVPLSKRLPFPKGELSAEPTEGLPFPKGELSAEPTEGLSFPKGELSALAE